MNWIDVAEQESDGRRVNLASLTPKFDEASRRVYYDLLTRAIDAEGVRNLALTGAYGTGKSSVLEELHRKRSGEVIELSLSTIAPPRRMAEDKNGGSAQEDEKSQTNLIQKEIVKQLLYRLPSHKTPRSRFRRTGAPQTRRDWIVSAAIGALFITVAFLLGLLHPLVESVVPEPWGRRLLAYLVLIGAASCTAWFIRRLVVGGATMSASVGAGLTSVTLSSSADTYFDEYLDEIVYFFQASNTKIVVIEDIDRFEDIRVFDTLRALNVLLNSSSTLGRIVFVYAIRDSIFERIESVNPSGDQHLTRRAVEVANRAKFFDVIVPVVPFVNADNARDLLSRAMESVEFSIEPSLIRVAARHVADMRLIHNIRNEFEVYRNRLIVPNARVYGITNDLVFAMIVFKNAHLGDFEKIRSKDSTLDHLYTSWRRLVRSNLKVEVNRLTELRKALELDHTADERARRWGQRLREHTETLQASIQSANGGRTKVTFFGEIDESKLEQRATWSAIASGTPVLLRAHPSNGYYPMDMKFSATQLGALLGITIDSAEWGEPVRSEVEARIADCEERIQFLRHHTWEELRLRPEFTLEEPEGLLTFKQLIHKKLASPLAEELVRRGFITSHFALYTSTYYGTHLGPDALEYVRRCIEPGEPDMLFQLDDESIRQLLIEQGADKDDNAEIFDDASILNIAIVNYLLQNRHRAAEKIAKRLTAWGELESEFVASYCARGERPELLLAAMAPGWPTAVQYAAVDAPLSPEKRLPVVDAVLGALPHSAGYPADDKVRELFEASYAELTSVASPASPRRAAIVMGVFATCEAMVQDVTALNDDAREAVIARRLYPVTQRNLHELGTGSSIALDALLQVDERVYLHAISYLGDYLLAVANAADAEHTIDEPDRFSEIVTKAGTNGSPEDVRSLVSQASANCRVGTLSEVPASAWPIILTESRTDGSFVNIHSYCAEHGSVDEVLAAFLTEHDVIEWDEDTAPIEDRREVSLSILNAADVLPDADVRIDLVVQLEPGELSVDDIKSEPGKFASRLIEESLIPDAVVTFASGLMTDWSTREAAIVASTKFESFVSPATLPTSQIPQLLQSEMITVDVKETVVGSLANYLAQVTPQQAEDIARALNAERWRIHVPQIQALVAHGASAAQIIRLIVRQSDIPLDALRDLLREMREPYSSVADLGRRPVLVPNDHEHRMLLDRLKGVTVSTYDRAKNSGSELQVNLLRKER